MANIFPGASSLQNFHPLIVHFPLVLLIAAAIVYLAAALTRRDGLAYAGFWLLFSGALFAGITVWTGLRASAGLMIAQSVRDHILIHHEHFMIAASVLAVALLIWAITSRPMPHRGRWVFLILMLVMVGILVKGADYGGWMVYGYDAGGSLPQPIEFSSP